MPDGGVPVLSPSPAIQRPDTVGGHAGVVVDAEEHYVAQPRYQHPNAAFQLGRPPQSADDLTDRMPQHLCKQQEEGQTGGGGGSGNLPQGQQPQPGSHYVGTTPSNESYGDTAAGGMGMGPSTAGQQSLIPPVPESRQHIPSGPQENALIQGISTEIHTVAANIAKQVERNPELESLSPQAPFDPNLICPLCRWQFRIGEIQKYRKHVKSCKTT